MRGRGTPDSSTDAAQAKPSAERRPNNCTNSNSI